MNRKWLKLVGATAVALLLALSAYWSGNNAIATGTWQLATDAAPSGLVAQIQAETLSPKSAADAGRMKIWSIQLPGQKQPLYLINSQIASLVKPNANPLCGNSGCAFFAYISTGKEQYQQVWSTYLNVHLPPKVTLFEVPDDLRNGMPMLKINQLQANRVQQLHVTFNGQTYEVTASLLTPQTYD
jgi:hypothetical protein